MSTNELHQPILDSFKKFLVILGEYSPRSLKANQLRLEQSQAGRSPAVELRGYADALARLLLERCRADVRSVMLPPDSVELHTVTDGVKKGLSDHDIHLIVGWDGGLTMKFFMGVPDSVGTVLGVRRVQTAGLDQQLKVPSLGVAAALIDALQGPGTGMQAALGDTLKRLRSIAESWPTPSGSSYQGFWQDDVVALIAELESALNLAPET